MKNTVALIIMDGFGLAKPSEGNAISLAHTPNYDYLISHYPNSTLGASGNDVGLPEGQMGNSEVGHLNIGAGRIVYQSLTRINVAIKNGDFYKNEYFLKAISRVKKNNSKLHILGLCSDGGVHSRIDHILALFDLAKKEGVEKIYYHAFLDGRDVAPDSASKYLQQVIDQNICKIATVGGRYYGMDRDKNWDRIQVAYDAMTKNIGPHYNDPIDAIKKSYENGVFDEFIKPFIVDESGMIEDGDAVIFANFRPDRAIQIGTALSNPSNAYTQKETGLNKLDVTNGPTDIYFVSMMLYSDKVLGDVAFGIQDLNNTYGDYVSKMGLKQLRIAETEKYAHVTFFFDGGVDKDIFNSTRILVDSPKVATYDLKPEMSIYEVTDKVLDAINKEEFDTIILNFANCDMVGHTGNIPATIKAVEAVDECLGKVYKALLNHGGVALITADHGNADKMLDDSFKPYTAHSTNRVPVILTKQGVSLNSGNLGDLAPTLLELLNLEQPKEMTGKSLIKK